MITADSLRVIHRDQGRIDHRVHVLDIEAGDVGRGAFAHYMLKEIFEQPESVENAMRGRLDVDAATAKFGGLNISPQQLRSVGRCVMTACGTSWHAALVGEYQIEALARLPVEVEYASELRYRNPPLDNNTLLFAITQSGETADTLGALREMKRKGHPTPGHLQRRRQHHRPGIRRRHLSPRRTGDRRRLDQGVHLAMHRAGDAGPLLRAFAAPELLRRHADHQGAAGDAGKGPPGAAVQRHGAADRRKVRRLQQLPLPGPPVQFPHRLGGRA